MYGPKVPERSEKFSCLAFFFLGNQPQEIADALPLGRKRHRDEHRCRFFVRRRDGFPLLMVGFELLPQLAEKFNAGVRQEPFDLSPPDDVLGDAVHVMKQCPRVGHCPLAPVDVEPLITDDAFVDR